MRRKMPTSNLLLPLLSSNVLTSLPAISASAFQCAQHPSPLPHLPFACPIHTRDISWDTNITFQFAWAILAQSAYIQHWHKVKHLGLQIAVKTQ